MKIVKESKFDNGDKVRLIKDSLVSKVDTGEQIRMRKLKVNIYTSFGGTHKSVEFEIDDEVGDYEAEQMAEEIFNESVDYDYEIVEE